MPGSGYDSINPLNVKTLREQVYDYVRESLNRGEIEPGVTLDLNELSQRLGISRTPLRDALLHLEKEGFVRILPRRGCVVRSLTRQDIENLYQMIGALEAAVVEQEFARITPQVTRRMGRLNDEMKAAIDADDFDAYYVANLTMHDCVLKLSNNEELIHLVGTMKQRLYDFPRRRTFVKEWELASTKEHGRFIELLEEGEPGRAAAFVREVHWSFAAQRRFIEHYYPEAIVSSAERSEPR